jgi:hypothetical protein
MADAQEILTEEREFYQQNRAAWLKDHAGKFALVKRRQLVGFYESPDLAYQDGLMKLGNVPMLVIQVLAEQPVARFPALQLGLMSADFQNQTA